MAMVRFLTLGFGLFISVIAAQVGASENQRAPYRFDFIEVTEQAEYIGALNTAQQSLLELFADPSLNLPPLHLVLTATSEQRKEVDASAFQRPFLVLSEDLLEKKATSSASMADVVAHEACHLWLIALAEQMGIEQQRGQIPKYGHAQFNDWFDEMVAVRCEGENLSSQRLKADFEPIPLAEYFTQTHPVYAQIEAQIAAIIAAKKAQQQSQSVIKISTSETAAIDFYYQSAHLAEFILSQKQLLSLTTWFTVGMSNEPEVIAKQLGFNSLAAMQQSFNDYLRAK